MPALNPEIIKDTKSLISFYQKNPRFKTAFDRVVANNINATYHGRPVKLYVEVLKNVTSKYKQEYSQIRKIEHDTEGKVGELFNKVNPKSDFELLDKAYNAALRGKNITEFKNDDENKEIDEINEIEKSKNNKEKRQAYERREEMARVQEQPPQETPVEAIVGSSGEPSSQPSLPSISNIPRPSSIRQFISSPRTYVSNVFRGGTSAGRVAASGAGRVIGKIGLNTAIKAGAGAAAKLGASILAGAATGGIGLIVGIATTFPGVTKKLFKDASLIVVGLIFFIFFMFAFQRGMKMNSLLPPYDVPTMGSVAPTLPAGDLDKRCNFSAFDILNANAVNDDLLKKYTDRALASGKIKTTEQKDNLLSRAKYIRDQAQAAGLNPAIFLGYWESESAFSDYSHPGVRPGMDLGCDPLNKALNTFEADVLCAIGKSPLSNSRTSQCALSKNINSDACKAISFQQTEGVKLPISTLKDFLDSYGSKVADPNNTTSDNIVKQNIVDLGLIQCSSATPPSIKPGDYCGIGPTPSPNPNPSGKVIVLNPGHAVNPKDSELTGAAGEAERNVALAKKIQEKLTILGYQVSITHDESLNPSTKKRYEEYQDRIDFSNSKKPNLFVEIHFNSGSVGPSAYFSDRKNIYSTATDFVPNDKIVTSNVDKWIADSQKINALIVSQLAKASGTASIGDNLKDSNCVGRACGGHFFTIGPEGFRSDPERPESIIIRENKAVSAYIETLGMNHPIAADLDTLSTAYVNGIQEYFGANNQTLANTSNILSATSINIPDSQLTSVIQDQFGLKMVGFSPTELRWTYNKLSDISGTNFIKLFKDYNSGVSSSNPVTITMGSKGDCHQVNCKNIIFCPIGDETTFDVVLLHEIGHIVEHCAGTKALTTEHLDIYQTTKNPITLYGGVDWSENYPEMLTYYLNPNVTERTSVSYTRSVIPYNQSQNLGYYQLANKILCGN